MLKKSLEEKSSTEAETNQAASNEVLNDLTDQNMNRNSVVTSENEYAGVNIKHQFS